MCGCACTVQDQTLLALMMQLLSRPAVTEASAGLCVPCPSLLTCNWLTANPFYTTTTNELELQVRRTVNCRKFKVSKPIRVHLLLYISPATLCSLLIPVQEKKHDFVAKLGLRLNWSTWGKVSFLILFPEDTAECNFLASTDTSQFETDAVFH